MSERTLEKARQVVHRLSEWYFAEGGDNDPDSPIDREDLYALREGLRLVEEWRQTHEDRARMARVEATAEMERRQAGAYAAVAAVVRRELEAPAAGERRELVAREVFALDEDWRREYWLQFRREFPRQAQVYYDTADRILALLRPPRGDEEAWRAFLDAVDEFEAAAASLWADPAGPTAEDIERLDRARQRVIECGRALAAIRPEAQVEDRWEDLVFGPITAAYREAHAARRGEGGGE